MTHAEAIKEMKMLAGERAWSFMYEVNSYSNPMVHIHGYIEDAKPNGHAKDSTTYAGAIENVKKLLAGDQDFDPAPDDIPVPEEKSDLFKQAVDITNSYAEMVKRGMV
jgi:hypothetical protein